MELPSTGRRATATWPLSGRPTISLSSCYKRENRSRSRSLGPPCRTPASGRVRGRDVVPLGELNPCVEDFNPDSGTLHIRTSKTGNGRHVILTDEGQAFFSQLVAGRVGKELMLRREWK